jgi:glyoxylase-like metal-dependent hydrolase (beta-lactamase superfamily II)
MARSASSAVVEVVPGVGCFRDTCNVYVLRTGREAVLVDFGSGAVLDDLADFGVDRVTDVLLTHHHRDQLQGLGRAVAAGARIWAPPVEIDLIAGADEHWQRRQIDDDYDLREDRFSLLAGVPVDGTVDEYRTRRYGGVDVFALPTPGHTVGSITYLVDVEGRRLAFTGDLLYADGKVWSLAATQWSYTGVEGQESTIVSCSALAAREPDVLLPSHGGPVTDAGPALAHVASRLRELVDLRLERPSGLAERIEHPFDPITPHLLRNRTTESNSYVVLSESGAALLIDFGYDSVTVTPSTTRAGRRTLLWSLDALRRDYGVERIEVAVATHYHDDHVAGFNLLRDVEGTEVWAPSNVAPIVEEPHRYDLPCLWHDPIRVDRVLPLGEPVAWRELELTAHAFPGHTLYAAAISFEVDGKRVVAAGDQYAVNELGPDILNYQYRNRFRRRDFVRTAELLASLRPDVIVSGHWLPREVTEPYLEQLRVDGERLAQLHDELLPEDGFGEEGVGARIEPYRSTVAAGAELELSVTVRNPFDRDEIAVVELVLPDGWERSAPQELRVGPHEDADAVFRVRAGAVPTRRARIAADLTVGGVAFGQQAEALVDVE